MWRARNCVRLQMNISAPVPRDLRGRPEAVTDRHVQRAEAERWIEPVEPVKKLVVERGDDDEPSLRPSSRGAGPIPAVQARGVCRRRIHFDIETDRHRESFEHFASVGSVHRQISSNTRAASEFRRCRASDPDPAAAVGGLPRLRHGAPQARSRGHAHVELDHVRTRGDARRTPPLYLGCGSELPRWLRPAAVFPVRRQSDENGAA